MKKELLFSLFALPFSAFSPSRLAEVRSDQDFRCADCGTDTEALQVHHRVPQRYHGTDRRVNAVALCPECHQKWDDLADEGTVYPGIGYDQVERRCFENPPTQQKIINKFSP